MLSSSGQPVVSNNGNGYLGNTSDVRLEKTAEFSKMKKMNQIKR